MEIKTYFELGQSINEQYAPAIEAVEVDQINRPSIQDLQIGDIYTATFINKDSSFLEVSFPNSNLADCFDHVTSPFQKYSDLNISVHRTFTCRRPNSG